MSLKGGNFWKSVVCSEFVSECIMSNGSFMVQWYIYVANESLGLCMTMCVQETQLLEHNYV